MRIVSLTGLILLSIQLLNAQTKMSEKQATCEDILKQLSVEWKADSLGLTGYRYKYFHALSRSKSDGLSKSELLKHLGPPNIIRKTAYGNLWRNHVEYVYFILHDDPNGKLRPFVGAYLAFVFDEGESLLEEIKDGLFCE